MASCAYAIATTINPAINVSNADVYWARGQGPVLAALRATLLPPGTVDGIKACVLESMLFRYRKTIAFDDYDSRFQPLTR